MFSVCSLICCSLERHGICTLLSSQESIKDEEEWSQKNVHNVEFKYHFNTIHPIFRSVILHNPSELKRGNIYKPTLKNKA